ncbi:MULTISPECIES: ImmA/IrrE family metallo-endopeptidase [unclassified Microbacterium]|uniref:ImmA/IrrE family metallo-endopeptidase n=1 Tax=unclassified Microbacterium TaxID=2609290 RepID=UPI003017BF20
MKAILAHAATLGVSVHVAHLPAPYRGFYDHGNSRVVYDFNLTPIERACVVAHELGHVFHGHTEYGNANHERMADLYAARLLIEPAALARLSREFPDGDELAEELGVERRLLDIYLRTDVRRLGQRTYVRARHGSRQFAYAE